MDRSRRKCLGIGRNRPDVRGYTKRPPEVSPCTSTAAAVEGSMKLLTRGFSNPVRGARQCVKAWAERPTLFSGNAEVSAFPEDRGQALTRLDRSKH
jgi:hypothetical protein